MIGFPLGVFYANAVEWVVHKYLLHGLGRKKGSFWSFHWREHHKNCRKYGMRDPDYLKPLSDWNARGKEAAGILLLCAAHLPLAGAAPYFTVGVFFSGLNYLRKHRKSHVDPEWAMKHMRWHVEHHLGKDQDKNWCVSQPWFDRILGTRVEYPESSLRLYGEPPTTELASGVYDVPLPGVVANDGPRQAEGDPSEHSGPPSARPPRVAA